MSIGQGAELGLALVPDHLHGRIHDSILLAGGPDLDQPLARDIERRAVVDQLLAMFRIDPPSTARRGDPGDAGALGLGGLLREGAQIKGGLRCRLQLGSRLRRNGSGLRLGSRRLGVAAAAVAVAAHKIGIGCRHDGRIGELLIH